MSDRADDSSDNWISRRPAGRTRGWPKPLSSLQIRQLCALGHRQSQDRRTPGSEKVSRWLLVDPTLVNPNHPRSIEGPKITLAASDVKSRPAWRPKTEHGEAPGTAAAC